MPRGLFPTDLREVTRLKALDALVRASACVVDRELPLAIVWAALGLLRLSQLASDATIDQAMAIVRGRTQ